MRSEKQTRQPVPEMADQGPEQVPEPRREVTAWSGLAKHHKWQTFKAVTKKSYRAIIGRLWLVTLRAS